MSSGFSKIQNDSGNIYRVFLANSTKWLYTTFSKKLEKLDNKEIGI